MNYKNFLITITAVASTFPCMVMPLSAATYGPYTYTDNVTSVTITDYSGSGGNLSIPERIAGKQVTTIGDWAFNDCCQLTSVTIPTSVTFIGKNAFGFCLGLTKVTIPNSVIYIGDGAFHDCSGLSSFTIPNRLATINNTAFASCTGLTHIEIPSSVTKISWFAFLGCTGLTSVTISPNVNFIGEYAFSGCSNLRRASFLGNAPEMERASSIFGNRSDFTVTYLQGKTGFTTPTWNGYPCLAIVSAPEISVEQPAGSGLTDGKSKRSFGTIKRGKAGTAKTFMIRNTGTGNLTGIAVSLTGKHAKDFVLRKPGSFTLAPGASTAFKITFKPIATGTRNAAIHIKSNDANENPFDIKLTGMGATP